MLFFVFFVKKKEKKLEARKIKTCFFSFALSPLPRQTHKNKKHFLTPCVLSKHTAYTETKTHKKRKGEEKTLCFHSLSLSLSLSFSF